MILSGRLGGSESELTHVRWILQVWNCTQDRSNEIVHEFFDSHHFAVGILPIPGQCAPSCVGR